MAAALAQVPPTPGTIQDTVREPRPAAPSAAPELIPPKPAAPQLDPNAPRFSVAAIQFTGNTVFSAEQLQALIREQVRPQMNLFELNKVAETVTQYYRAAGYILARAVVPAQRIESGVVRIELVEGRLGKLSFAGNQRYADGFLALRLAPAASARALPEATLERGLLLLNDLPGATAQAVLEPGTEFGTTDMRVQVTEKRIAGMVGLDNFGRREVGNWRAQGGLELNSPLGVGDQLTARGLYSEDGLLKYARAGYSLPVGAQGTRVGIAHSDTHFKLRGAFTALDIVGDASVTEIMVNHPWLRTRRENLIAGAGIRTNHFMQRSLGATVSDTKISVLTLSLLGNRIHAAGAVTTGSVAFITNGGSNPDGTQQDKLRAKYDLELTHLRNVAGNFDIFLRGNLVYSPQTLPDSERFSLGGPDGIRGFPAAEVRGDRGHAETIEGRYRFAWRDTVGYATVFVDSGQVKRINPGAATASDSLASGGVGLHLFPTRALRLRLEYARRLDNHDASDGKNSGRVWAALTYSF